MIHVPIPTEAQIRVFVNASDEDMENQNEWETILEIVGDWFTSAEVDFNPVAEKIEAYLNPLMGAEDGETLFDSVYDLYSMFCDFLVFANAKQKQDILNIMLSFAAKE